MRIRKFRKLQDVAEEALCKNNGTGTNQSNFYRHDETVSTKPGHGQVARKIGRRAKKLKIAWSEPGVSGTQLRNHHKVMTQKKVTQASIAKLHGISRQAVGYALGLYTNSSIKLRPETQESIVRTAKALGYRPNRLAQIISGRRSGLIGVMNFGGITQMSAQNAQSVATAIQSDGYQLLLHDVTWYQGGALEAAARSLLDLRVEGIVMISPTDWLPATTLEVLRQSGTPLVSFGGVFFEGIPHVESDYESETCQMVSDLLDLRYRSFTFLTSGFGVRAPGLSESPPEKRARGFRKAIEQRGGVVREIPLERNGEMPVGEIFHASETVDWNDPYHAAYMGAHQVLARKELPEVIICSNDDWAMGVLRACGDKGLRVPEDVAIAGHDGTVVAGYGYRPITTVMQPTVALAKRTVQLLQRLIQKQPIPAKEMTSQIRGKIAWRTSTRIPQKESA